MRIDPFLMERYQSLGQVAGQINTVVQQIAAQAKAGRSAEISQALPELVDSMGKAATAAEELMAMAEDQSFSEVAQQADALRQQILSARNKLSLLQQKLGG